MDSNRAYYQQLIRQVQRHPTAFIAHNATVLGEVVLAEGVSIWYQAVIRADHDIISIGAYTNVQDGCIFHVDAGFPIHIGRNNVIGHAAIIHGATIGDGTLIGMRATLMNGAQIGNGCIIGAHALVTEGMVIPDYSLVMGMPAKVIKRLPEEVIQGIQAGVESYKQEAQKYLQG